MSELRRTAADPDTSEPLREAAARRLARLAAETIGERQLVPPADPASWWGTRSASLSTRPVRDPERPVPISASLLESVMVCPAQWFLRDEAGGIERAHQEANIGQLLHALAERVASGELTSGPGDVDELMTHVDAVWDRLHFRTPWSKAREHARVRRALTRFLEWHYGDKRELVDVESRFSTVVELPDGEEVELTGYADRIERDAEGRLVVVDLKTGRSMPTNKSVGTHRQLALYQYAVDSGALDEKAGEGVHLTSGGAELVQLGRSTTGRPSYRNRLRWPTTGPNARTCAPSWGGSADGARRGLSRGARAGVPRLCVRADLPGEERRVGAVPVTTIPREIRTPEELQSAMGTDWAPSTQQWAAITAPLTPAVVIAGAGSGKTSLMAARVVYLVVTGQVRPEEVLGLTFTTKAAGELRQRIRDALLSAGAISEATSVRDDDVDALEPTVSTYNAYAANLLAEHGLRIGHEPETRVITDASRYQLAPGPWSGSRARSSCSATIRRR